MFKILRPPTKLRTIKEKLGFNGRLAWGPQSTLFIDPIYGLFSDDDEILYDDQTDDSAD